MQTKAQGVYAGLLAAIGELNDLLPQQSKYGKERLEAVLKSLESLKALALCVSLQGDEDPVFRALFDDWRKILREQRKEHFDSLEHLAKVSGVTEGTLHLIETGNRIPGRQTMEALLGTTELGLDKNHLFAQIIINRSDR